MTIQEHLNNIDYSFKDFVPSKESLMFFEFIKQVNNGREENDSPLVHCMMLDKMISSSSRVAIMASRGLSKSSIIEYLVMYLACFEELGAIKKPTFIMYIADSIENGVKRFRSSLELKYANSEFLQKMIPNRSIKYLATDAKSNKEFELSDNDINDLSNAGRSITDVKITFINVNGTPLCIRNYGIKTGIRGTREFGVRPSLCHKKGTMIISNEGYHKVEDYSYKGLSRFEKGIEIKAFGLVNSETVTREHRYMIASKIKQTKKINLVPQHSKSSSMKGLTKSITLYEWIKPRWVEAQDICVLKNLGNQKIRKDYLVKEIDYSVRTPEPFLYPKTIISKRNKKGQIIKHKVEYYPKLHKHISNPSFWYLYGLYLSDGTVTKNKVTFTFDDNKPELVNIFLEHCKNLEYKPFYHKCKDKKCHTYTINDTSLAKYHKLNHKGNSIKFIPEWILYQPLELQKQLLLGYINGDGYIDYKRNQLRINSVNEDAINKLGFIAERLGLPYHIRWARAKCFMQYIPGAKAFTTSNLQWEIRFSQNVKEILGINIQSIPSEEVFIKDNKIYRKIKSIKELDKEDEFIPIQTPSHTYQTQFGLSHNCFLDDLLKEEDARSETILKSIDDIVYQSIPYALHPTKQKIIWVGTPFNESDPLYKSIESGRWNSLVLPICEKFPCSVSEFKGAWEDRFPYEVVNNFYQDALAKGNANGFYQELMMSVINEDNILIKKDCLIYLDDNGSKHPNNIYNYYITTDLAVSTKESADNSVISVWAYTANEDFVLVDGFCGKVLVDEFMTHLFRFVSKYKPLQVGLEVTGQQGGFVQWIMNEQYKKSIFFDIKEIRPNKDKYSRFLTFAPYYHRKKVKFSSMIKGNTAYHNELMNEISKVTLNDGFKSKHDDILDTHSMLQYLDLYAPSYDVVDEVPTLVVTPSSYYWDVEKPKDYSRNNYI